MSQSAQQIKEKIMLTISSKGPILPIHISKEIDQSMLFTSAFLSELIAEKKIKMSHMRVGSSPVYYLEEQLQNLERFSNYLKSKEKEAYAMLKENKFLEDIILQPAIRVALREIKDFAKAFKYEEKIFWRYFIIPESEFAQPQKEEETEIKKIETAKKEIIEEIKKEPEREIEEEKPSLQKPTVKKKVVKKKTTANQKKNEKFFEKVKNYLDSKEIQITNIIGFNKTELTLKIKEDEKELLLIAFNKKRIGEKEIVKCHEKAKENNLSYRIFVLGEPTKKMTNLIEAIKNLNKIETI